MIRRLADMIVKYTKDAPILIYTLIFIKAHPKYQRIDHQSISYLMVIAINVKSITWMLDHAIPVILCLDWLVALRSFFPSMIIRVGIRCC